MRFTDLRSATEMLYGLRRAGIKLDLGPVIRGLRALGDPQRRFRAIHIAGTNGKGSTAALCEVLLRGLGHRTGLYTSPHLVRFSERIRVDGRELSEEAFMTLLGEVLTANPGFSFFEAATAMALCHFARENVTCAVMETGLGGRLDATRAVDAAVSVITSIGRDHALALSGSLRRVAWEKAGIMEPGVPCIIGSLFGPVDRVLREAATSRGVELLTAQRDFVFRHTGPMTMAYRFRDDPLVEVALPLVGIHQPQNLAFALTAVRLFSQRPLDPDAVQHSLEGFSWPGRLSRHGRYWLDGAHNPPAAEALATTLGTLDPPWDTLGIGMNADKEILPFLRPLIPLFRNIVPLPVPSDRGLHPKDLETFLRRLGVDPLPWPETLSLPFLDALPGDRILVTGSFYLVGEVQKLLLAESGDAFPLTDPAQ